MFSPVLPVLYIFRSSWVKLNVFVWAKKKTKMTTTSTSTTNKKKWEICIDRNDGGGGYEQKKYYRSLNWKTKKCWKYWKLNKKEYLGKTSSNKKVMWKPRVWMFWIPISFFMYCLYNRWKIDVVNLLLLLLHLLLFRLNWYWIENVNII